MKACIAAVALLFSISGAAVAADAKDPVVLAYRMEQASLANHNGAKPPWFNGNRDKVFSRRMSALFARDDKYMEEAQGVGLLDWDPFIDGQDGEVKKLVIKTVAQDAAKAQVDAKFSSFGHPMTVRFDVVLENGAWRIDDIRSQSSKAQSPPISTVLSGKHDCGSETGKAC